MNKIKDMHLYNVTTATMYIGRIEHFLRVLSRFVYVKKGYKKLDFNIGQNRV